MFSRSQLGSAERPMLFSRCRTCGVWIDATARICPRCAALTSVTTRSSNKPASGVLGFSAAVAVAFCVFLALKWLDLL
jgi:hypothetical protein